MVRPLHVAVSRQLQLDALQDRQQEEPLLQQISAPSSPCSPHNADSQGLFNSLHSSQPQSHPAVAGQQQAAAHLSLVLPVLDSAPASSELELPPGHSHAAASACAGGSATSLSPAVAGRVAWLLSALLQCGVLLLSLLSLHLLSMDFQQTQLRCSVLAAAHLLSLPYPRARLLPAVLRLLVLLAVAAALVGLRHAAGPGAGGRPDLH